MGTVWLRDHFQFADNLHEVEEAFITGMECELDGATARIYGQHHDLSLTIEQPQGLPFRLEHLEEQSKANQKAQVLKRLSFVIPATTITDVSVRMTLSPHSKRASS